MALAQTPPTPTQSGVITIGEALHSSLDTFINADECTGAGVVRLGWLTNGPPETSGVTYQLFAANKDPNAGNGGACPSAPDPSTNLHAGTVAARINPTGANPMPDSEYATSAIAAVAGFDPATGDSTTTTATIFLCVEGVDPTFAGSVFRARTNALTLDRRKPTSVEGGSATTGDGAVHVSWTERPDTDNPPAEYYVIDATVADTTVAFDPITVHTSDPVTTSGFRFGGLVNGVVYGVRVWTFSPADNRSDPTFVGTAQALPSSDFWESYKTAGGREQGGCASGPAGLVAIAGAAAVLALAALRRRR